MAKPEAQIGTAAVADPKAREFLVKADPVMARLIEAHPDFRPRAWMDELPLLDAFGTLVFQVGGQQLSVAATRKILSRVVENFGGRLPHRRNSSLRMHRCFAPAGCRLGRAQRYGQSPSVSSMGALAMRCWPG